MPETAVLHYTVKPERLEEHLQLLTSVYGHLARPRPQGFRWATYRLGDSRDFIEVVTGDPLPGPLPDLPASRRCRAELEDRCGSRRFDEVTGAGSFGPTDGERPWRRVDSLPARRRATRRPPRQPLARWRQRVTA